MEKPLVTDDSDSKQNFFSNFSSIVGKVANNATTVIKDKVNTSMIAEFNKEQEDFIKNKGMYILIGWNRVLDYFPQYMKSEKSRKKKYVTFH